tara:strand:+ start:4102 stop:5373 length:1272 start_codon:yes stop_codon:yes gene_type:complete
LFKTKKDKMKKCFAISICFLIAGIIVAQPKKVLFIGNSYTYVNDLPQLIQEIGYSLGDSIVFDQNTPGGAQLVQHASNATTLTKIKAQDWDFVVLQEQSQKPAFSPAQVQSDVYPYAKVLNDSIKANYNCSETVFYMTWGRKNGDASNCAAYPPVCTYNGMQQRLRESYLEMADSNKATVAPVGVAWKNVRDSFPTIELYQVDESHPSLNGSYLAACVFYCTIFQKSCIGSTYMPAGIGTADAFTLQTIATNTVLDSMDLWRINADHPTADFNFSGSSTINFNNLSANGIYYHWNFDDGNTSAQENPTHAYTANGNYDVELTVFSADSCSSDTTTQTVTISSVGINEMDLVDGVTIYPNPTKSIVNVVSEKPFTNVEVYDAYGRLLFVQSHLKIDLSDYSDGLYFIRLMDHQTVRSRKRIMKI